MSLNIVVGAGPVGRETANLLARAGNDVVLVSRRGTAADVAEVRSIALDARDGQALGRVAKNAQTLFMCAMAEYTRWPEDFPPIMDGVATAAEISGARLVVLGNLYGHGEGASNPLTSSTGLAPTTIKGRVRVAMWERALRASPAIEVRASDYLGATAASVFTLLVLPKILAGEPVAVPADLDAKHAWSFTKDVARTLVAASTYEGEWGRAFLVPSQHASFREVAERFAAAASASPPQLQTLSKRELDALGRSDALMREIAEMSYLLHEPSIVDASDSEELLGVSASNLDTIIEDTLKSCLAAAA